jgi:hypothetical protein
MYRALSLAEASNCLATSSKFGGGISRKRRICLRSSGDGGITRRAVRRTSGDPACELMLSASLDAVCSLSLMAKSYHAFQLKPTK